jgi:uncharacterized protein (TIGR00730 family)
MIGYQPERTAYMNGMERIAVFCGSSQGHDERYAQAAKAMAVAMADRGVGLVYGGGNIGLMGLVAETLHSKGGAVVGVIPRKLHLPKICNTIVHDELLVVEGMHERKAEMYRRADGFVALPGGIGTFEEILEIFTWQQLRYHTKPVAILNTAGFYDGLLAFLRHSCDEGFIKSVVMESLLVDDDPARLLLRMETQVVALPEKII